jgi:hypothetical protein
MNKALGLISSTTQKKKENKKKKEINKEQTMRKFKISDQL